MKVGELNCQAKPQLSSNEQKLFQTLNRLSTIRKVFTPEILIDFVGRIDFEVCFKSLADREMIVYESTAVGFLLKEVIRVNVKANGLPCKNESIQDKVQLLPFLTPRRGHFELTEERFTKIRNICLERKALSCSMIKSMNYTDFLLTEYWHLVSWKVKQLAGSRCRVCNSSEQLEVHHRNYKIHGLEIFYLDKELTCLYSDCHTMYHEKIKTVAV